MQLDPLTLHFMIAKNTIGQIVAKQHKMLATLGGYHTRELSQSMPYITDKMLLIGGVHGCGCTTLLTQMLHNDYPEAWYTDFDDPRLAGFDTMDFTKLERLLDDSGKGIMLFNRIDNTTGWFEFCAKKLTQGAKIIATISLETLLSLQKKSTEVPEIFTLRQLTPCSYLEFLSFTHKPGGEQAVNDYLTRGSFPELIKAGRTEAIYQLYNEILYRDTIVAGGIRDRNTLQRIALYLFSNTGETVTANKLREILKIKAVSTVAEHMQCLEQAGLVNFISILSDNPARQTVNPRKVYAIDTALASALTLTAEPNRNKLFETLIFNHIHPNHSIFYTAEEGGCDFIATDEEGTVRCIQACYDDDPDQMQIKKEGLLRAMEQTGSTKGIIVTLNQSDRLELQGSEIEITDADTFLSEY